MKSNSIVGTFIPSYIFSPNGCFLAGIVASGRDGSFLGFLITSLDSWYSKANLSKYIKTCSITYRTKRAGVVFYQTSARRARVWEMITSAVNKPQLPY